MRVLDRGLVAWVGKSKTVPASIVLRSKQVRVRRVSWLRWTAQSEGGDRMYAVDVRPWRCAVWCSCPDSMTRKRTCKHSVAVLREMLEEKKEQM